MPTEPTGGRGSVRAPFHERAGGFLERTFRYWSLLPVVVVLLTLTAYPILALVRMSLSEVTFRSGGVLWDWVGLENFQRLFTDVTAGIAFTNTLWLVVISVAVETALGLVLALMVSRTRTLNLFYRTVAILPLLIPPIAIGAMWFMMLQFNYGFVNTVLLAFGQEGRLWLSQPNLAFGSVVVVDIWHWTSFQFLILLAGVESLPHELNEAAEVDGATRRQVVWHITLPLLRPVIMVAVTLRTIFAFKVFEQIYLLTGGGPGSATEVISSYIESVFFEQGRMGYGAALSLVTAVAITLFIVVYQLVVVAGRRQGASS